MSTYNHAQQGWLGACVSSSVPPEPTALDMAFATLGEAWTSRQHTRLSISAGARLASSIPGIRRLSSDLDASSIAGYDQTRAPLKHGSAVRVCVHFRMYVSLYVRIDRSIDRYIDTQIDRYMERNKARKKDTCGVINNC